jgi:2-phosphosulfolactate phosphatase
MQVDVVSSVNEAISDDFMYKTVIVIDVLRATSTIVTALERGCTSVIPVETVNLAKSLQQKDDLLGGERFCKKIPGFHFGNSPLEYTRKEVEGKRIILTTTNGTRAIHKAQKASHLIVGSLLNASMCASAALSLGKDVVILCSGTLDEFSLEDGLCAGFIVEQFTRQARTQVHTNDLGLALQAAYLQSEPSLTDTILGSSNGKRLCKIGYKDDVSYCSQTDILRIVPYLNKGSLVPFVF